MKETMPLNNQPLTEINVDVFDVFDVEDGSVIVHMFSYESTEPFAIICEMSSEHADIVKNYIDKQIHILLTAYAVSDPNIYDNEEDFEKRTKEEGVLVASQSFLANPGIMVINEVEIPVPEAMMTGIVRKICLSNSPHADQCDSLFEVEIEMLGIVFTAFFENMDLTHVKPGNIITCIYYLMGELPEKF
jgi:hypothetical protein